ncbi:MAG: asparagine synthase (glutamine-hydrolyzing) [Deltaproteobacteria bacterium]|nr:asparagine synthase (glutamine-hydrolyzing) [Deltaproteobacteria bacterium]
MCGICGLVGAFVPGLIEKMNALQAHRGPDGRGVFEDKDDKVALGSVRLKVIDLSDRANQPMHSLDQRLVIVFNGEIYNFRELRRDLETKGYVFRTQSDTEVLLNGLIEYREEFIRKLNGIFAFAFWDRKTKRLLLARDPIGVKPLYYCEPKKGQLLFASEIKAFLGYRGFMREINFEALQEHLARCHASGNHTLFKGVFRLPPGSYLLWESKTETFRIIKYWEPPLEWIDARDYTTSVEDLKGKIIAAIKRQMVSDVPIGAFLSGGLDSTLITILASKLEENEFYCYTISYPQSENILDQFVDDTPYALSVSQLIKKTHVFINIKPSVADLFPAVIWHLDEPIADPAVFAAYLISEFARRNGTIVLLSGQGADELFGGYPRYVAMNFYSLFKIMPRPIRVTISWIGNWLPGSYEGKWGAYLRRLKKVLAEVSHFPFRAFMSYSSPTSDEHIKLVLNKDVYEMLKGRDSAAFSYRLMENLGLCDGNAYLYRDLVDYLPNHNLLYMDKMSMAWGVEVRVPLIDIEIVETVTKMPYSWKVKGTKMKRILSDVAKDIVPEKIIKRKKTGFGAPYRKWLKYDLEKFWQDIMAEDAVRKRGWFDPKGVKTIRELSQKGKVDLYMLQWALLTCEVWARVFLDSDVWQKA